MKKPPRRSLRLRIFALVLFAGLPASALIIYSAFEEHRRAAAGIAVVNPVGGVMCSTRLKFTDVSYTDRHWFQNAISRRNFVACEYVVGRVTKLILPQARSLVDAGAGLGKGDLSIPTA